VIAGASVGSLIGGAAVAGLVAALWARSAAAANGAAQAKTLREKRAAPGFTVQVNPLDIRGGSFEMGSVTVNPRRAVGGLV